MKSSFMRAVGGLSEAARAISFQLSSPAAAREGIAECAANHLRIAHAIASRDPQKARQAMESVIKLGVDRIRDVI